MFKDETFVISDKKYLKNARKDHKAWYKGSLKFWQAQEATTSGVLLGYEHLDPQDIQFSREILKRYQYKLLAKTSALDCGAGTGRVSANLLKDFFTNIDLVEPVKKLLDKAKEDLSCHEKNKFKYYVSGLQDFRFVRQYDCIWSNWSLCFLTDKDLLAFLKQAKRHLRKPMKHQTGSGLMFIKENTDVEHRERLRENQIVRTTKEYEEMFAKAEL